MRTVNGSISGALLSLIVLGIALAEAGAVEEGIAGDAGHWQSLWVGLGHSQAATHSLPSSCIPVARALDAAKDGDFDLFCSYFLAVRTNDSPAQVKSWYDEWKAGTQLYIYLIGQEALLDSSTQSNGYAAVSIVPAVLKNSAGPPEDFSRLKADVIFARQTSEGWRLLPEVIDKKLRVVMAERATRFKYAPFNGGNETMNPLRDLYRINLEERRRRGASSIEILSLAETIQVLETGSDIRTWNEWTNYYHAVVLDPPVSYDIRTNALMDFSTPASACRSFQRAFFLRDHETLLKHADSSAAARLKGIFASDDGIRRTSPRLAVSTLLLTAWTTLNGREYAMVLWRSQNAEDPTNDLVSLQEMFFVYNSESKSYLMTEDLRKSTFESLLQVAHAAMAGLGPHQRFYDIMKQSSFPTNFYMIK